MAYADARNTQRKLGTALAVGAIEVGLVWAIVAGLAVSFSPKQDTPIKTVFTPEPQIDKPKVPPRDPVRKDPFVPPRPVADDPPIDLGSGGFTGTSGNDGTGSDEGVGTAVFPTPTPDPPTVTPIKARPRGDSGQWVTPLDYPSRSLRLGHEGISRFRLTIDAAGKPTSCTTVLTSGHAELDDTACAKLMKRAKFDPATDSTGARVEGYYVGAVNWQIPED